MQRVHDALAELVARPEVAGAVLVGPEGLLVASHLPGGADGEALAALAVTLVRDTHEMTRALGRAAPERILMESPDGLVAACPLADGAYLLVLARPGAPAGRLLFDLRRLRGDLTALL